MYFIPANIVKSKAMKKAHILIIADTLSINNNGLPNSKSQSDMALEYGLTRKTINSAISDLAQAGLIIVNGVEGSTLELTVNQQALSDFK